MVISTLSIQSSSFTCHTNIFPTLIQLENPTMRLSNITILLTVISATLQDIVGGIFPYFTLFDRIEDPNVLKHYPKSVFTSCLF